MEIRSHIASVPKIPAAREVFSRLADAEETFQPLEFLNDFVGHDFVKVPTIGNIRVHPRSNFPNIGTKMILPLMILPNFQSLEFFLPEKGEKRCQSYLLTFLTPFSFFGTEARHAVARCQRIYFSKLRSSLISSVQMDGSGV